jgi:hypothetical protein
MLISDPRESHPKSDIPIAQGLTETCAGLTIQAVEDLRPGIAGVAIPSVEIKLESTPDVTDRAGLPYSRYVSLCGMCVLSHVHSLNSLSFPQY